MINNFMNPNMMALLGAAQGLLQSSGASPRQITMGEALGNGLQGGMQGMQQGMDMQMRGQHMEAIKNEAQMKQNKLLRDMEIQEYLRKNVGGGDSNDPVDLGKKLISSGYQELIPMGTQLLKSKTAKSFIKGLDDKGQPTFYTGYSTGEVAPTGVTPAEKLMQINRGSQIDLATPYTGQVKASLGVGMSPGQAASLSQAERHFNMSHELSRQNAAFSRQQATKPQFKDGYWVTPPNANNPQGGLIPTELSTAPKGSSAEKARMSERVKNTLGNDTEQLIKEATGSTFGSLRDSAASFVGVTTDPAKANATLKIRAATLAANMPRFEGPQSDTDRQYYLEMAGDLANPSKTTQEKLMALEELKRINNLVDDNGVVRGGAFGGGGGFKIERLD